MRTGPLGSLDPSWRHIHLIGVAGAGNSAMAEVLVSAGYHVSGSDSAESGVLDRLRAVGVQVHKGHRASNVLGADCVVYSAAVRQDNAEMSAAASMGVTLLARGAFLGRMMDGKRLLAIAGTHGKTTTSAMCAWILMSADRDPTFVVGSEILGHRSGARLGSSDIAVVEADEAYGSFLSLKPSLALVLNVDEDHLDHYGSMSALHEAFRAFIDSATEVVIVCSDHLVASSLAPSSALTYGLGPQARLRGKVVSRHAGATRFQVTHDLRVLGEAVLKMPGDHNVSNALAAMAACMHVGVSFDQAVEGLATFSGTNRRFEYKGSLGGAQVIDDYAHHPVEVKATLTAARERATDRVIAVFQPHLYSRTASMWSGFAEALSLADIVIVTDVYAAREDPVEGVSGRLISDAIVGAEAFYAEDLTDAARSLISLVREGDLVVTMGAGDVGGLFDLARGLS